jgi:hypothetical protein
MTGVPRRGLGLIGPFLLLEAPRIAGSKSAPAGGERAEDQRKDGGNRGAKRAGAYGIVRRKPLKGKVPETGIEPALPITGTRPSTWRVRIGGTRRSSWVYAAIALLPVRCVHGAAGLHCTRVGVARPATFPIPSQWGEASARLCDRSAYRTDLCSPHKSSESRGQKDPARPCGGNSRSGQPASSISARSPQPEPAAPSLVE